jgi:hypothetical protein
MAMADTAIRAMDTGAWASRLDAAAFMFNK